MENRLKNKTVLITGASSGIGAACAEAFAKSGANLVLTARRVDRLEALKSKLESKYSVNIFVIGMDVTNPKQVAMAFNHLPESIAPIDVLINNAGLSLGLEPVIDDDTNNWDTMIDTNIKGFLAVLRIVAKDMVQRGEGHIINMGSIAGIEAYGKAAVYAATKHAVHAITQSLREELIEHGIKVSEVLPGAVNTEFSTVRFKGNRERANKVYQGFESLAASDIADTVVYVANLPKHVNLAEVLILPSAQARATMIHRKV